MIALKAELMDILQRGGMAEKYLTRLANYSVRMERLSLNIRSNAPGSPYVQTDMRLRRRMAHRIAEIIEQIDTLSVGIKFGALPKERWPNLDSYFSELDASIPKDLGVQKPAP